MNKQIAKAGIFQSMFYFIITIHFLIFTGCVFASPQAASVPKQVQAVSPSERVGRLSDYVIINAISTDTYESLAHAYLGDARLAYLISEYNRDAVIVPGMKVVVPLKPTNPGGLYPDGYQTVPVLSYHRIEHKKNKTSITVSEDTFERQMAYLKNNGYHVLTLKQFMDFIDYRRRPPKKSVLITFDDGWKSTRTIAYPILKKYGFTAVLFIYTDVIKSKQNPLTLCWDDVWVLKNSGVFEIGSHTVSHSDLNKISDDRLMMELRESRRIISEKLGATPFALAYPNGLFNENVVNAMKKNGYTTGFTVIRGGNPFFNSPFSLNRSMVYNKDKIDNFVKLLETFRREQP